jgi:GAF domain
VKTFGQLPHFDLPDSAVASICSKVGKFFRVTQSEVALLELQGEWLSFLHPAELSRAGSIHLWSSAVAARTARAGKAELFNDFTREPHQSLFELILTEGQPCAEPIQKLMSASILTAENKVWGVIQVSRRARDPEVADFTSGDLEKLQSIAAVIGKSIVAARDPSSESLVSLKARG